MSLYPAHWDKNVDPVEVIKTVFGAKARGSAVRYWKAGPEVLAEALTVRDRAIEYAREAGELAKQNGVGLMFKYNTHQFNFFADLAENLPEGWRRRGSSDASYWIVSDNEDTQNAMDILSNRLNNMSFDNAVSSAICQMGGDDHKASMTLYLTMKNMDVHMVGDELFVVTKPPENLFGEKPVDCLPGCTEVKASAFYAALERQQEIEAAKPVGPEAP